MEIQEARDALLKIMDGIDKEKLSLYDLKTYAETLKIVSDIQIKSFSDYMKDFTSTFNNNLGYKVPTIADMKGDAK